MLSVHLAHMSGPGRPTVELVGYVPPGQGEQEVLPAGAGSWGGFNGGSGSAGRGQQNQPAPPPAVGLRRRQWDVPTRGAYVFPEHAWQLVPRAGVRVSPLHDEYSPLLQDISWVWLYT